MDKIAVLDFGGQYAHLIANRIRRYGVYSEIFEGDISSEELKNHKGIILSGGPASVNLPDSIKCDPKIFELGVPILGICYGHQLIAHMLGGQVSKGEVREYGKAVLNVLDKRGIFAGLDDEETVWMSHFDVVSKLPEGFKVTGDTEDCNLSSMANFERNIYGIQFHPEVTHSEKGEQVLQNFLELTKAEKHWNMDLYLEQISEQIKEQVGDKKVFLMISGGVDSSVTFLLLAKVLGAERVYGLLVDTGFMRLNEIEKVSESLKDLGVTNLRVFDAKEQYFKALEGVVEPEEKRKIIGKLFLDVQKEVSAELELNPEEWLLGQGTIYPDTIESGGTKNAHTIKTHHNRVEEIAKLIEQGRVIEPIASLYKDEVRELGRKLGLRADMVERHPFPGPGLAIRALCSDGSLTSSSFAEVEKEVNKFIFEMGFTNLRGRVLPVKSVGVQGDERTYAHPLALFDKEDKLENIDFEKLDKLSTAITNHFPEINRVILGVISDGEDNIENYKCDLNPERIAVLQAADHAVSEFCEAEGLNKEIWQFPTVLLPVSEDLQDAKESVVLRPVESKEAMTANFYRMKEDKLNDLVEKIIAIEEIDLVFYDLTNKPPGTIEWE
jgi:GMP synthase (glutamine-hydrolysing)